MNAEDRKTLDKAYALLDQAKALVEEVSTAEQEKYDNMTEGLQATERGQRMDEVATLLAQTVETIDEVMNEIDEAKG